MKKILSLLLAVLMAFSILVVSASAADTMPMEIYDLLKHKVDSSTGVCTTVEIFFRNQLSVYDSSKKIQFINANGTVVAECKPHEDNNRLLDLYTPAGDLGVKLDPTYVYYLTVEEGAYATTDGVLGAACKMEYFGTVLTSTADKNTVKDLGITNFVATKYDDAKVYGGKLMVDSAFTDYQPGQNKVTLFKMDGAKAVEIGNYAIVGYKNGVAEIDFGKDGVAINKFDTYKLRVMYGSLIGKNLICDHSEFTLSGKKLLNKREDYPAIDLLIKLFGADSKVIGFIPTILNVLATIKLIDKALSKDIEKYIKAKKG